jgi:hypothetical protein
MDDDEEFLMYSVIFNILLENNSHILEIVPLRLRIRIRFH